MFLWSNSVDLKHSYGYNFTEMVFISHPCSAPNQGNLLCTYGWVPSLFTWNYNSIVNWLYTPVQNAFGVKKKIKKKKKLGMFIASSSFFWYLGFKKEGSPLRSSPWVDPGLSFLFFTLFKATKANICLV